jgi:hypothetical protein
VRTSSVFVIGAAIAVAGSESALGGSIDASFTDGSLLVNGSVSWPEGSDFAQVPGFVAPHSAGASGSTSGGLIEASADMGVAIAASGPVTTVSLDATLAGSQPPGYGGFAFLGVTTEDLQFFSDPLRLTIAQEVVFNIQSAGPGFISLEADPASTGEIVGDHLLPGSYFISISLQVTIDDANPSVTNITDWTLTLTSLCPADVNGDSQINVNDLLSVIGQWGSGSGSGDVTGDGIVDVDDLLAVINQWGACP